MTEHHSYLRAGIAQGTITPPLGTWMSGFGGRVRPAGAIHDDLRCTALALEDGATRIAILSADLVGLPVPLAQAWRAFLAERSGIPASHILLSCTHSHSGPTTGLLWENGGGDAREAANLEGLKQALAGALETALAKCEPATLIVTEGRLRTQFNRRDRLDGRAGPVDDRLGVLRVDREDGTPLGLVVNYACHPTNVGGQNTAFSAEYPGEVREAVQAELGVPCLFLQGAGADHNPLSRTETGAQAQETAWQLEAAEQQGLAIGREAVRLAAAVVCSQDQDARSWILGAAVRQFQAPLAPLPGAGELDAMLATMDQELALLETQGAPAAQLIWKRRLRRWPQEVGALARTGALPEGTGLVSAQMHVPFEVQALRIGDLAVVGLPVEPFSAIGLALQQLRPEAPVWCAGYANGVYGYLAPAEEYPRGGYEIQQAYRFYRRPAPLAPECAALVIQAAGDAIKAAGVATGVR